MGGMRTSPHGAPPGRPTFRGLLVALRARIGAGSHWPADSGFEIMAGAVLVQRTTWGSAQRSLEHLREAAALDPAALLALEPAVLAGLIRPSGFMTGKSRSLRALAAWLRTGEGVWAAGLDDGALRARLLALPGIGPETADVISLYAYHRPRFIWDAYARGMLSAVGYPVGRDYETTRRLHQGAVADEGLSAIEHQELHWLVVTAGPAARADGGWERYAQRLGLVPGRPAE